MMSFPAWSPPSESFELHETTDNPQLFLSFDDPSVLDNLDDSIPASVNEYAPKMEAVAQDATSRVQGLSVCMFPPSIVFSSGFPYPLTLVFRKVSLPTINIRQP